MDKFSLQSQNKQSHLWKSTEVWGNLAFTVIVKSGLVWQPMWLFLCFILSKLDCLFWTGQMNWGKSLQKEIRYSSHQNQTLQVFQTVKVFSDCVCSMLYLALQPQANYKSTEKNSLSLFTFELYCYQTLHLQTLTYYIPLGCVEMLNILIFPL